MTPVLVFDTECYPDYFLVAFKNIATGNVVTLERTADQALDVARLNKIMANQHLVGFNSNNYDLPVLAAAITGADNATIKDVSDSIINGTRIGHPFEDLNHIDLIEVAPGMCSLKQYAGRLHAPRLADLPFDPNQVTTAAMRDEIRRYCINDLDLTERLYRHLLPQIDLRRAMTTEYQVDLRSKSDAQIAETVIKKGVEAITGKPVTRVSVAPNTKLTYTAPDWVAFRSAAGATVLNAFCDAVFPLDNWGSPVMPKAIEDLRIRIGATDYQCGMGGLHSTESRVCHLADDDTLLIDRDVASYYPAIILQGGIAPSNMGQHFLDVYRGIVQRRLAAKKAKDAVTADALKICVNGSFGKLGSKWSVLYAPQLMLQVTLTGQLALLMLIEQLEHHGIPVVSANTDGVVIKCRRDRQDEMQLIIDWWETVTGFETEAASYRALYCRDVNNYIAIKTDGTVKGKGIFARTSLMKTPSAEICTDAVVAYLRDGTPVADTIAAATDISKFVVLRQVKGGGLWRDQYLGKTVRWYYSKAGAPITYKTNGNRVARSDGAMPAMVLPSGIPSDLDIAWYITEAEAILEQIGTKPCAESKPRAVQLSFVSASASCASNTSLAAARA